MHARVVRFTDVDPDHMAGRLDEVEASEGPPVDIPAKGVQILHDPDQRTAVVIQLFETADDMSAAEGAPRSTAARSRPTWDRGKAPPRHTTRVGGRRGAAGAASSRSGSAPRPSAQARPIRQRNSF